MDQNITEIFIELLGKDRVHVNEPMSRHTSFRIGGPADYFLQPSDTEQIKKILDICRENKLPFFVLGNGSNLLVSDTGFSGVIIQLFHNFERIIVEDTLIRAQAGALDRKSVV